MLTVYDVAAAILARQGTLETLKLQKLVYYAQAWYLAWYDEPLFAGDLQAWELGPMSLPLYSRHWRHDTVSEISAGHAEKLDEQQSLALDAVLAHYGHKSTARLIDMAYSEKPWRLARKLSTATATGYPVISPESMRDYYRELQKPNAQPEIGITP